MHVEHGGPVDVSWEHGPQEGDLRVRVVMDVETALESTTLTLDEAQRLHDELGTVLELVEVELLRSTVVSVAAKAWVTWRSRLRVSRIIR